MKAKCIAVPIILSVLCGCSTLHGPRREPKEAPPPVVLDREGADSAEPWIDLRISHEEREIISSYYKSRGKSKQLPPGLRKKQERGKSLPPGWQKKIQGGQVLSEEVYRYSQPLPHELRAKLPPEHKGTVTIVVGGKVIRILEATREILDVLDIGY